MGACFSKCGGKNFNKKDGGNSVKEGDTPKLVNKIEHKASFSEKNGINNGSAVTAAAAAATARIRTSSSSSNEEDKKEKVGIDPETLLEPNLVTNSAVTNTSQMTSASETTTTSEKTGKTITVQQETSQTVETTTSQQVLTVPKAMTREEVEALVAAGNVTTVEQDRKVFTKTSIIEEVQIVKKKDGDEEKEEEKEEKEAEEEPKDESQSEETIGTITKTLVIGGLQDAKEIQDKVETLFKSPSSHNLEDEEKEDKKEGAEAESPGIETITKTFIVEGLQGAKEVVEEKVESLLKSSSRSLSPEEEGDKTGEDKGDEEAKGILNQIKQLSEEATGLGTQIEEVSEISEKLSVTEGILSTLEDKMEKESSPLSSSSLKTGPEEEEEEDREQEKDCEEESTVVSQIEKVSRDFVSSIVQEGQDIVNRFEKKNESPSRSNSEEENEKKDSKALDLFSSAKETVVEEAKKIEELVKTAVLDDNQNIEPEKEKESKEGDNSSPEIDTKLTIDSADLMMNKAADNVQDQVETVVETVAEQFERQIGQIPSDVEEKLKEAASPESIPIPDVPEQLEDLQKTVGENLPELPTAASVGESVQSYAQLVTPAGFSTRTETTVVREVVGVVEDEVGKIVQVGKEEVSQERRKSTASTKSSESSKSANQD